MVDSQGRLWVGTRDSGLALFDPATSTFVRYNHDPADPSSLSDDHIYAIAEDHPGAIWVGTDAGLSHLRPGTGDVRHGISTTRQIRPA